MRKVPAPRHPAPSRARHPGSSSRSAPGLAAIFGALLAAGCSDAPVPAPQPAPYEPPPASAIVEEGAVRIRREVFLVPGVVPPPNPVVASGGATPPALDFVRVVRYRVDADPPLPARSIAVLMPGFLGGAGNFDSMARALVRRSREGDALEAWAIDRRGNLLEDHHGSDVAEVRKDPELASRYYFEGEAIEGKTFEGYLDQSDVAFSSEWGLATTLGDLKKVIELVAPAERRARVVLVGHSLGVPLVEEYAAWDFDGMPGYEELAGIVLVDGATWNEGKPTLPEDEQGYLKGTGDGGFLSTPGLEEIRQKRRHYALPILGFSLYSVAAIASMRALWSPGEIVTDPHRDKAFQTLLALSTVPRMTNRAALGFAFDDDSNGVAASSVISCGRGTGGALEPYQSLGGGTVVHPSDPHATYDWVEFDAVSPAEFTSLDDVAAAWFHGPELDFSEWYFPTRIPLDVRAASSLVLKPGDWPLEGYGLRAMHGAAMDLPVLVAVAASIADLTALDSLRDLLADVPVGPGRPLAGTPRSSEDAFHVVDVRNLSHVDVLAGSDSGGVVTAWFDTLAAFMRKNAPPGGVTVEAR